MSSRFPKDAPSAVIATRWETSAEASAPGSATPGTGLASKQQGRSPHLTHSTLTIVVTGRPIVEHAMTAA